MAGPGSRSIGEEEVREVLDVISSGHLFRYGSLEDAGFKRKVYTFEQEFAAHCGLKYALATSSGTAALVCALKALGIADGDEVIVPAGAGFNGIVVALFAQLHPLWSIPASVLFGGLLVGANSMQRAVQVPSAFVTVLNGLVVIFVVSSEIWTRRRQRRRLAAVHEDEQAPPPADKEKIQAEAAP